MGLHSRHVGKNIVWYESHRKNIIDAIGPDVIKVIQDFTGPVVAASDALVGWTTTLVEAGLGGESTVTIPDGSGGTLLLTTDNAENDGINLQKIGENFSLSTSQQLTYFGIRFKISDKTQSDFIVGLCITDTTLLGGMTDGVYFRKVDGSASVAAVTEKDSTETETLAVGTMVDDTYVIFEAVFEGSKVEFFIDGVSVASHTANIPDDELLTESIHFLTGEAAVKTMTVDWIRAVQIGR
jgi:hypothetical protein